MMAIFIALSALGVAIGLAQRVNSGGMHSPGKGLLLTVLLLCFVIAPLVIALRGLRRRQAYGRWLGLCFVLLWLGFAVYQHPNPFVYTEPAGSQGPIPTFKISPKEQGGAIAAQVSIDVALLTLVLRLLFAKSVRGYFSPQVDSEAAAARSR